MFQEIPWDHGQSFAYAWGLFIGIQITSILLNLILIVLILRTEIKKVVMANVVFALCVVDLMLSITCFGQCLANLIHGEFFGHEVTCRFQAFYLVFFAYLDGLILSLISYAIERLVCAGISISNNTVAKLVAGFTIYSAVLTVIFVFSPYGGFHLDASGTHCFLNTHEPIAFMGVWIGLLVPAVIMFHNYLKVWKFVSNAQKLLNRRGYKAKVKAKMMDNAKKNSVYILVGILCSAPFALYSLFEMITATISPENITIIAGIFLHTTSINNPIIFIFVNKEVRVMLRNLFCNACASTITGTYSQVLPQTLGENGSADADEWLKWIEDEELLACFEEWCEEHYVAENVCFYQDAVRYQNMGQLLIDSANPRGVPAHGKAMIIVGIGESEKQLHELATQIYEFYIQTPDAPMEVNISHTCRSEIMSVLHIAEESKKPESGRASLIQVQVTIPEFEGVAQDMAKCIEIVHVFDMAAAQITRVISTDIFPRFRKSPMYAVAKASHEEKLRIRQLLRPMTSMNLLPRGQLPRGPFLIRVQSSEGFSAAASANLPCTSRTLDVKPSQQIDAPPPSKSPVYGPRNKSASQIPLKRSQDSAGRKSHASSYRRHRSFSAASGSSSDSHHMSLYRSVHESISGRLKSSEGVNLSGKLKVSGDSLSCSRRKADVNNVVEVDISLNIDQNSDEYDGQEELQQREHEETVQSRNSSIDLLWSDVIV